MGIMWDIITKVAQVNIQALKLAMDLKAVWTAERTDVFCDIICYLTNLKTSPLIQTNRSFELHINAQAIWNKYD